MAAPARLLIVDDDASVRAMLREYLEGHGFGLEEYLRHPLQIEKGEAIAPDRPGHGVELDWEKLEAHRAKY